MAAIFFAVVVVLSMAMALPTGVAILYAVSLVAGVAHGAMRGILSR